ncbi:MAG: hypothetical protein ACOCWG_02695 [bacterium]
MKKIKYLIFIIWIIPSTLKADVIYSPYTRFGAALSLELIGSYELSFTKYNTINFWGGFGAVSMFNDLKYHGLGTELAIELRQYFKSNAYKNFNVGLYAGVAYMKHPYFYRGHLSGYNNSFGFVPGMKLTYKKRLNSWLVGEPYIGISTPWYDDNFKELFNWIYHSNPGLILTLGLRIGFNKVRFKNE